MVCPEFRAERVVGDGHQYKALLKEWRQSTLYLDVGVDNHVIYVIDFDDTQTKMWWHTGEISNSSTPCLSILSYGFPCQCSPTSFDRGIKD